MKFIQKNIIIFTVILFIISSSVFCSEAVLRENDENYTSSTSVVKPLALTPAALLEAPTQPAGAASSVTSIETPASAAGSGASYVLSVDEMNCMDTTALTKRLIGLSLDGNLDAKFNLGVLGLRGAKVFIGRDRADKYDRAIKWFTQAANGGHVLAQYYLGRFYKNGRYGLEENTTEALKYFGLAAEAGNPDAQYEMAGYVGRNEIPGINGGDEVIMGFLEKAAEKGHVLAKLRLGIGYVEIEGGLRDVAKGKLMLEELAKAEDGPACGSACDYLGTSSVLGRDGFDKDIPAGLAYLRRAVEVGNSNAQYNLGGMYMTGKYGVEKNIDKAYELLKQASEQDPAVAREISKGYSQGIKGFSKDAEKAKEFDALSKQPKRHKKRDMVYHFLVAKPR